MLAVILKFAYLCCYGVSITKEFNWQAGEAQCFDCEKVCACALKFKTLKWQVVYFSFSCEQSKKPLFNVEIFPLHNVDALFSPYKKARKSEIFFSVFAFLRCFSAPNLLVHNYATEKKCRFSYLPISKDIKNFSKIFLSRFKVSRVN